MNRKSKRDPRRKPKHLDRKGNSTSCIYFTDGAGQVIGKTTTFVTPEMRRAREADERTMRPNPQTTSIQN
jgi:hypothetical protein